MTSRSFPRLDKNLQLRNHLLQYCRIQRGEIWDDHHHRVGCLDAACANDVHHLLAGASATLSIQDPPYNVAAFEVQDIASYLRWSAQWIKLMEQGMKPDSSLYVWLGASQHADFQPLPDFMLMMRETGFRARSFITMRNQRGHGTQKNWMSVRQELLYYAKGNPDFQVEAEYTTIPKTVTGYYKHVHGRLQETMKRSKSPYLRAGNVWVDIQQVFHRLEENVHGCYAQKPLKSCERIIRASSHPDDIVIDFFCHSGSTLLACEKLGRRCITMDIDPVYCEIAIRRLERFRTTNKTGWQHSHPFEAEMAHDPVLRDLVTSR